MLGSSRLTAYHIFAISMFNVLILFFPLTEREVVDSKPHHHEKMLQTLSILKEEFLTFPIFENHSIIWVQFLGLSPIQDHFWAICFIFSSSLVLFRANTCDLSFFIVWLSFISFQSMPIVGQYQQTKVKTITSINLYFNLICK